MSPSPNAPSNPDTTTTTTTPQALPVITIDPTFASAIADVDAGLVPVEQFWLSCYKAQKTSVHAKVHVELDEVDRGLVRLRALEGDDVRVGGGGSVGGLRKDYTVSCNSLNIPPTRVALPVQEYRDAERSQPQKPHRITAFDLSPDGSRFATGFLDGSVFLYPTTLLSAVSLVPTTITPTTRATSRPHLSTITHLCFFPSSRVLLTAAGDFSLAILPADLPPPTAAAAATLAPTSARVTPARTLRGHTRAITSTAIIALGRNVLSASLDSTLRLWDVPSSTALATLPTSSPALSMSVGDHPSPSPSPPSPTPTPAPDPDPRELPETAQKTVFAGLQSGAVEQFDLRAKRAVFRTPVAAGTGTGTGAGGVSAVAYEPGRGVVVAGTTRGVVRVWDVRMMGAGAGGVKGGPMGDFWRNEAGVEDLVFLGERGSGREGTGVAGRRFGVAVATADGLPYVVDIVGGGDVDVGVRVGVRVELAGGDCDPVRVVRTRGVEGEGMGEVEVWSAGDDAVVRRYLV